MSFQSPDKSTDLEPETSKKPIFPKPLRQNSQLSLLSLDKLSVKFDARITEEAPTRQSRMSSERYRPEGILKKNFSRKNLKNGRLTCHEARNSPKIREINADMGKLLALSQKAKS